MTSPHPQWWKGQLCLALLVFLLLVVLARCWQLQHDKSSVFNERARHQQIKIIPQTARRGEIVDRRGRPLAISTRAHSVGLDPTLVHNSEETARRLGATLILDTDKLHQEIITGKNKRFIWVKRFITDDQAHRLEALDLPGAILQIEYRRRYPMGSLAAHVIGFTDVDGTGLEGAEASYDNVLRARSGQWFFNSDVRRRPIAPQGHVRPAKNGQILVLTIDAVIQSHLEDQLRATVDKFQANGATGIVMNPRTFEIYAMAIHPTFDLANARQAEPHQRRNRALTDPVEPGSLFKPFTVASAIEGNFVTLDDKIDCLNGPYIAKGIGRIGEYKYYFGSLNVWEVLARSSNIGSAKIAQKMGKDYFFSMIRQFGFGGKTGIDLPGEGDGILVSITNQEWKWGDYALTRASFGQGPIAATPIQLMRAFCCLANGGKLMTPRIAKAIISADGNEVVKDFHREANASDDSSPTQVVANDVAAQLVERALTAVVERQGGTAHNAHLEAYRVFGKTGTANVPRKDGRGYEHNKYISSFMAGAPANDPRVCVLIMVHQPDRSLGLGYTGGAVAAAAVGSVIRRTLAYLKVPTGQLLTRPP